MMKMKTTLAALLLAGFALNAKAQNTPEGKILLSTVQYQKVEKLLKDLK